MQILAVTVQQSQDERVEVDWLLRHGLNGISSHSVTA